jgi:hypothetical protein
LLRPDKDDELLASILKDSTVEVEDNKARAKIQYIDEVTGQTYGSILCVPNIEQIYTEEAMRRVVAPQLWTRVTMGRVSFYAKQVR